MGDGVSTTASGGYARAAFPRVLSGDGQATSSTAAEPEKSSRFSQIRARFSAPSGVPLDHGGVRSVDQSPTMERVAGWGQATESRSRIVRPLGDADWQDQIALAD